MEKKVWKVKVNLGYEQLFEKLCKENNIFCKPYPKPIESIYRAECTRNDLLNMGHCITSIEEMPIVTLS